MFQPLPDLCARQLAVGFFYVMTREKRKMEKRNMRWQLMFYDILILLVVDLIYAFIDPRIKAKYLK